MASPKHLAVTQRFIDQNPLAIQVRRRTLTPDGTGGTIAAYVDVLGLVTVRRVLHSGRNGIERVSEAGHTVIPTWTAIMLPDEDVQLFDQFDYNDKLCEVVWLSDSPPWRLQAEVYQHA